MRRKPSDFVVIVDYESTPEEVSERLTKGLLEIYDKLSVEERERFCRNNLRDKEQVAI